MRYSQQRGLAATLVVLLSVISLPTFGATTLLTMISWHTPIGPLNGCKSWGSGGAGYAASKSLGTVRNSPIVPAGFGPSVGATPIDGKFLSSYRRAIVEEAALIRASGFDVIAFDMLPNPNFGVLGTEEPFCLFPLFREWLEVASAASLKVAPLADVQNQSAEFPNGRRLSSEEWVSVLSGLLDRTKDHPALWRPSGLPAVLHFGTDPSYGFQPDPLANDGDGGWLSVLAKVRSQSGAFSFYADVRNGFPLEGLKSAKGGSYMFAPGAPTDVWNSLQSIAAARDANFIWSVSPGYYMQGRRTFIPPDFDRIHRTYKLAMSAGVKIMNVVSWNDLGEDTDIVPSENKGRALLGVFAFYNQWFKTGKLPVPTQARAVFAYPLRLPAVVESGFPSWDIAKAGVRAFQGGVYYWAISPVATSLTVGSSVITVPANTVVTGRIAIDTSSKFDVGISGRLKPASPSIKVERESQGRAPGGLEFRYVDVN
ncbi:hypothetical protein OPU71_11065 [Niveibacterium sp. 24ML]|uniref:hypothetical protein n=1 Tax=Niveibacterium sp. 24ML TaxID=2985512 RepID=UPI00227082CD|nr:hypothetical protein [Niveibacterium sp. 24ML]MCX9156663.1 hypothetical protein [Niveibacterium sp. 24ML]